MDVGQKEQQIPVLMDKKTLSVQRRAYKQRGQANSPWIPIQYPQVKTESRSRRHSWEALELGDSSRSQQQQGKEACLKH